MKSKENQSHILLEEAGLKKTDARIMLLDFLAKNKKPFSVKAIVDKLSQDKVTVYRMLETMSKKGLIRRVDTGEREAQYEILDHHNDHHHIICLDCKKVEDFVGCGSEDLVKSALKKTKNFKSISHHSFDLFGLCNTCTKK